MPRIVFAALLPLFIIALAPVAVAHNHQIQPGSRDTQIQPGSRDTPGSTLAPGLTMPKMDAVRGRQLFAGKGCVLCHSINGVGGNHARRLDADTMPLPMNPFEFAAKMWRGAEAMIALQREELGGQIALTGQDLADIITFVHNAGEQKKFSAKDIPHKIKDVLMKTHPHSGTPGHGKKHGHDD